MIGHALCAESLLNRHVAAADFEQFEPVCVHAGKRPKPVFEQPAARPDLGEAQRPRAHDVHVRTIAERDGRTPS